MFCHIHDGDATYGHFMVFMVYRISLGQFVDLVHGDYGYVYNSSLSMG
jgi:hypothetical protein